MADRIPSPPPPEHPSPTELSAYRGGALSAERQDEIRRHLGFCRGDCVDWILDLAELQNADPPAPEGAWEPEKLEDWQALETRLGAADGNSPQPNLWPLAAAAMLLIAIALGAFLTTSRLENRRLTASLEEQQKERARSLGELRAEAEEARRAVADTERRLGAAEQQIATLASTLRGNEPPASPLRDPQLFVPSADLFPRDFVRSGGSDPAAAAQLTIPPGIDLFTVTLNLADPGERSSYRLRIVDRQNQEVWRGEGLTLTRFGNFSVVLSRRTFPDRRYRFEVDGRGADGWQTLESYELEISG